MSNYWPEPAVAASAPSSPKGGWWPHSPKSTPLCTPFVGGLELAAELAADADASEHAGAALG